MSADLSAETINVAISPCPNDSFIFSAWVMGLIPDLENSRTRFFWQDIDVLNRWAAQGKCRVTKVSASQALEMEEACEILSAGGAFGLEHGPKLVSRRGLGKRPEKIAVPGLQTTAFTLLRSALDYEFEPLSMPFNQIVDGILAGKAEAGLLIHETALLYRDYKLDLVLDLGRWWENQTSGLPLPLGCVVLRKGSDPGLKSLVEEQIRASLDAGRAQRSVIMPLVVHLAQELDPKVIDRHIQAYVNEYTRDMGPQGAQALEVLRALKHTARQSAAKK